MYHLLSRESMVSLSAPLVDGSHEDCRALKADPVSAALLPFLIEAHQLVLSTQQVGLTPERLVEIQKLEAALDERHDDVIRGTWHLFLAAEYFAQRDEDKEWIRALRDKVLPERMRATNKSYRDEVGQAELLRSRLTPDDWSRLDRLAMPGGGTLAGAVREWLDLAGKLGVLEDERSGDPEAQNPTGADVRAARRQWIRAMRTLRDALSLRGALPARLQAIFDRIDHVVEQARRRAGRTGDDTTGDDGVDDGAGVPEDELGDPAVMAGDASPVAPAPTHPAQGGDVAAEPATEVA